MSDDDEILSDHRWQRTKLVPPMLDAMGEQASFVRWKYELVPEIIWIGEIFRKSEPKRTVEIIQECAETAQELFGEENYVLARDYDHLDEAEIERLGDNLSNAIKSELSDHLSTLLRVYPSFPLAQILEIDDEEPDDDDLTIIADAIDRLSDKRSPLAMKVQGIWIGTLMTTGQYRIADEVEFGDINDIFDYPDTEDSRKIGSSVRASVNAMHGVSMEDDSSNQSEWTIRFWDRGFEVSECIHPFELDQDDPESDTGAEELDEEFFQDMVALGYEFEESLKETILDLWYQAPHDPEFTGRNEVLDGLLMRQVNLATNAAISPGLWTADTAGIILRCMTEAQITLEWFNQNGSIDDYKDFIDYGLGQNKLLLEHQRRMLDGMEPDDKEAIEDGFDRMEQSLEAQRYTYLLPVDVGHWADKNTRELATEANCKDLYDLRFQQHNPAVHGSWDFLYENNLVECHNPLHQYHRIPQFQPLPKIPFTVVEVGNLMNRSLDSWVQARGLEIEFEVLDLSEMARGYLNESGKFAGFPGL